MSQEIDYASVLADLEARKSALEAAIAGIKQLLGQAQLETSVQVPSSDLSEAAGSEEIGPGTFHGLSIAEAAKKYLRIVKMKQKTKTIGDAIQKGGIETTAKNFYANLYTILLRDKDFIKLDKYWGLAAWHPSRVSVPPAKSRRRTKRKKLKTLNTKGTEKAETSGSPLKVVG